MESSNSPQKFAKSAINQVVCHVSTQKHKICTRKLHPAALQKEGILRVLRKLQMHAKQQPLARLQCKGECCIFVAQKEKSVCFADAQDAFNATKKTDFVFAKSVLCEFIFLPKSVFATICLVLG